MRLKTSLLLSIILIATVPETASAAGDSAQQYSVLISTPKETILSGDEVPIHVVLTNISNHEIGIHRVHHDYQAACDYRILVQGKAGLTAREEGDWSICTTALGLGQEGIYKSLKPGERLEGDTTLTKIYHNDSNGDDLINSARDFDFSTPGKYVVQFLWRDYTDKNYVPSNKLTITVLPGNAESEAAHAHHFSIAISTPSEVIKSGDAVLIHVVETNISDEEITVPTPPDPTQAKTHYIIAVNGPNHTWAGGGIYTGPNMKTLKPGEQNEEFATLAGSPFDFSKPGEYVIQFFTTDGDGSNPRSVKSNKITINVTD